MHRGVCGRVSWVSAVILVSILLLPSPRLLATDELSLLLTSNLQGRFSLDEKDQDLDDPMLLIAQAMMNERRLKSIDLYLDLGNAFYPGPLSKYSSGSVVMDFFTTLLCDATLVSTEDMQIGTDALKSLGQGKKTRLLSASVFRNGKPLFAPYFIYSKGRASIAILGISSPKIRFDVAEKNLYNVQIQTQVDALEPFLKELDERGVDRIVILSGLSLKDTVSVLDTYKQIGMAICGGDNTGELYTGLASRVEMSDGRPIVMLPESDGYYLLDLLVDSTFSVKSLKKRTVDTEVVLQPSVSESGVNRRYQEFSRRLALWKKKFKTEEDRVLIPATGEEYKTDDAKFAFLLRDRFNAELSIVDRNTIRRAVYKDEIRRSDISSMVHADYSIFTYTLTGEQIKKILGTDETLVINGIEGERIQGYPIEDARKYRVASTQSAFEAIEQLLGEDVPFKNKWINVTDLLLSDFTGEKVFFKHDYGYLDRRFRTTIDLSFANYFENADITKDSTTQPPPGWPLATYQRWGLENKVDVTLYNRYHQFVLTPYMVYQRQDASFQQNLLRGTLLYNLNINDVVKPYQKSQVETVVVEGPDGLRPVRVRETVGAHIIKGVFSGEAGLGFEKQVHDPVGDMNFGAEAIANVKYPFHTYFTYIFALDSFTSVDYFRSEIENALSVAFNRYLGASLKYKFWYYNLWHGGGDYVNSQVTLSLDLTMDVKFW